MKKAGVLFLLIVFFLIQGRAEEIYYPELDNLFECDLLVDASYMRADGQDYFLIQLNDVLKGQQYGLKKGDYLRLRQLKHDGCGAPVYHNNFKRKRYYLKKYDFGWGIHHGTLQSIQNFDDFGGLKSKRDTMKFCTMTFNEMIVEFLQTYTLNSDSNRYDLMVSEESLKERSKTNIMVAFFEKSGRTSLGGILELVEPATPLVFNEPVDEPVQDCNFAARKPTSPLGDEKAVYDFVNEVDNPMASQGVEGRVIVKATMDTSGKFKDFEVLRGLMKELNTIAIDRIKALPPYDGALNSCNQAIECTIIFPVRFKIEDL